MRELEFSIAKYAPGASGDPPIVLRSNQVLLDGLGAINRAVERDLLSFRTGDVTVVLDNGDGTMDGLFSDLTPTKHWQLWIDDRGSRIFSGVILGQGSVRFDRKELVCEVNAYGPLHVLKNVSAESVTRAFTTSYKVGTATAGQKKITLAAGQSGSPIQTGDTVHLTDGINKEDKLVAWVEGIVPDVLNLTTALTNTYAADSAITVTTQFHRYKSIDFLVRALFAAAAIPVAEVRLSTLAFAHLTPAQININALPANRWPATMLPYKSAKAWAMLGFSSDAEVGNYAQAVVDQSWVKQDAQTRGWVDWTIYRTITQGEPASPLFHLQNKVGPGQDISVTTNPREWTGGYKYAQPTANVFWLYGAGVNLFLYRADTTDGTTWTAGTILATVAGYISSVDNVVDCEYDPVRDQVWISWAQAGDAAAKHTKIWDVAGAALVAGFDLSGADMLFGLRYIPEWDAVVGWKNTAATSGPSNFKGPWTMVAYRGTTKLWERSALPQFPVSNTEKFEDNASASTVRIWPTKSLRVYNGLAFMIMVSDGKGIGLTSADQFATFVQGAITQSATKAYYAAGWDGTGYRGFLFDGANAFGYFQATRAFSGIVQYADFDGDSVADALVKLAVLINAVAWVDDDLQGHFVSRDLFDTASVLDLDALLMNRSDDLLWDQARQFVKVTGGAFSGEAGDPAFASDALAVTAEFVPNDFFAAELAASYKDFYSLARRFVDAEIIDPEDRIFRPLDRVMLGGSRFLVYESDHDLGQAVFGLQLVEDL